MGIGPFESFAFPDVYTQTFNESPRATAAGGLRFPAFVGVADEIIPVNNYEMIRGSSAAADNPVVKENVSSQLDGTNRNFTVTYYPMVTGNGTGTTTTSPDDVSVYVNNEQVPVASVTGSTGEVYLVNIPRATDTVEISYFFKRTDTLYTDEDLSLQADGSNTEFKVSNVPIVDGSNGGITTTTPTDVTVKVDGSAVTVSSVDGDSGIITLASAPSAGSEVLVTYYSNEYQNTSDLLPSQNVTEITSVGLAPGTNDFVNTVDYVLDTSGSFSTINWGHSYKIAAGQTTIGSEQFDDSQISVTLFDNRVFRREATGTADGTNASFTIEATPMSGQGLGYDTDDPSKVTAYVGTSPTDASQAVVIALDASQKSVTLLNPPASDSTVYVTQYTNLLPDDTWTLTVTTPGATGVGEYSMVGQNAGTAMDVTWSASDTTVADPDFASENVTYPSGTGPGNSDAQVSPGFAVAETVSLTFVDASSYVVTSDQSLGSGTLGDNTGHLNQTYIDNRTGFRVTVNAGNLVTYAAADVIGYTIAPTFVTSSVPTRAIPGAKTTVTDTEDTSIGDTGVINTYNLSGEEPDVGDYYYIGYKSSKTDFNTAKFYTVERDMLNYTGPLSIGNNLAIAGHLAFLNGSAAIALLQIEKDSGSPDASDSKYIAGIDVFDQPMEGGIRPSLMQPVTTSTTVLNYLRVSNTQQSGIRYQNERMSYFGFPTNTSPSTAQAFARSVKNERMIAVYPDGGITTVPNEAGTDVEVLVDGSYLAAAVAGRDTSPAFDVATPLTRKPIVGFNRLFRRMDPITEAQTANAGITLLQEQNAGINVKIALTTDLSSVLTRTPSVIRIKDFVQKGVRASLQPYIGIKFLSTRLSDISSTVTSYLNALQTAQIIAAYTGVRAEPDPNDPTIVRVQAYYSPVLPLLWIVVTFNIQTTI